MQAVSQAWRRVNFINVMDSDSRGLSPIRIEVTLAIVDPLATAGSSLHTDDLAPFASVDGVFSQRPWEYKFDRYSTGEPHTWILGSDAESAIQPFTLYEQRVQDGEYWFGIVSNRVSDYMARFIEPPLITISFDRVLLQAIPGLTIRWSTAFEEMPRQITVTAWLDEHVGGVIVNSVMRKQETYTLPYDAFSVRAYESIINFEIYEYNRITIEINEWCLPYRYARVEHIRVGFFILWTNRDFLELRHRNSASPFGEYIPDNEVHVVIQNVNRWWNPTNPEGLFRFLLDRQEVTLRYGLDINGVEEWIPGGLFYLDGRTVGQFGIDAEFRASNVFTLMRIEYEGPGSVRTDPPTVISYYDLAVAAILQCELPEIPGNIQRWQISDILRDIFYDGQQAITHDCASLLQLCAHASSCGLWQDRLGVIHIEPIQLGMEFEIETDTANELSDISNLHLFKEYDKVATGEPSIWILSDNALTINAYSHIPYMSKMISDMNGMFMHPFILGDVNGDGIVDMQDADDLAAYLAGQDIIINTNAADIDRNLVIDITDLELLLTYVMGLAWPPAFEHLPNRPGDGLGNGIPSIRIITAGNQRYSPMIRIRFGMAYGTMIDNELSNVANLELARGFDINIWHAGIIVEKIEIRENTQIELTIGSSAPIFDMIEIEIIEWALPLRHARIEHVSIGPDFIIGRRIADVAWSNNIISGDIDTRDILRLLTMNRDLAVSNHSNVGDIEPITNALITTEAHAIQVLEHIRNLLQNAHVYNGAIIADPRLDELDTVLIKTDHADMKAIVDTLIYRYTGGRIHADYRATSIEEPLRPIVFAPFPAMMVVLHDDNLSETREFEGTVSGVIDIVHFESLPPWLSYSIDNDSASITWRAERGTDNFTYTGVATILRHWARATVRVRAVITALPTITLTPSEPVVINNNNLAVTRAIGGTSNSTITISHNPGLPSWITADVDQNTGTITWIAERGTTNRTYNGTITVSRITVGDWAIASTTNSVSANLTAFGVISIVPPSVALLMMDGQSVTRNVTGFMLTVTPMIGITPNPVEITDTSLTHSRTVGGAATGTISISYNNPLPANVTHTINQATGVITWIAERRDNNINTNITATVTRSGISVNIIVRITLTAIPTLTLSPAPPVQLWQEHLAVRRTVGGTATGNIAITYNNPLPSWLAHDINLEAGTIDWRALRSGISPSYNGIASITRQGISTSVIVSADIVGSQVISMSPLQWITLTSSAPVSTRTIISDTIGEIALSHYPSLQNNITATINQDTRAITWSGTNGQTPTNYSGTAIIELGSNVFHIAVRALFPALPSLTLSPNVAVSVKVASPVEIRTVGGQATGTISVTHSPVLPAWLTVTVEQGTGRITWAGTRGDAPRYYTGVATVARQGVSIPVNVSATLAAL